MARVWAAHSEALQAGYKGTCSMIFDALFSLAPDLVSVEAFELHRLDGDLSAVATVDVCDEYPPEIRTGLEACMHFPSVELAVGKSAHENFFAFPEASLLGLEEHPWADALQRVALPSDVSLGGAGSCLVSVVAEETCTCWGPAVEEALFSLYAVPTLRQHRRPAPLTVQTPSAIR